MASPKGKPTEVHRRLGNAGHRATSKAPVVLAASARIPALPASLQENGPGAAVWDRIWTACASWLSPTTDLDIMTRLCEFHDERKALLEDIAAVGYTVPGYNRQPRVNPLMAQVRVVEASILRIEDRIGLNPSDRGRLGWAEVKTASVLSNLVDSHRARFNGDHPA